MNVLVDSSVWIDFFRGEEKTFFLNSLILSNQVLTNDLILSEMIPFLRVKKQRKIIELLNEVRKLPLSIYWPEVMDIQYNLLKNGVNGVGIPDIVIFQNARNHQALVSAVDNHLKKMCEIFGWHHYFPEKDSG